MAHAVQAGRDLSVTVVGPSVQWFAPGAAGIHPIQYEFDAAAAGIDHVAKRQPEPAKRRGHCLHGDTRHKVHRMSR